MCVSFFFLCSSSNMLLPLHLIHCYTDFSVCSAFWIFLPILLLGYDHFVGKMATTPSVDV